MPFGLPDYGERLWHLELNESLNYLKTTEEAHEATTAAHAAATSAHGVTGAVVGTTDTQTLSNKTLTSPAATGDLSAFGGAWTAYTPAWTSTSTLPALGNGTITGAYVRIGKTVHYRIRLVAGTTSTYGAGNYLFSLPVPALAAASATGSPAGVAIIRDGSPVAVYHRLAYFNDASTVLLIAEAGTAVGPTSPITFASTDSITITGTYEAA